MSLLDELRKPREIANGLQVGECYGCYDKQRAQAADEIERLTAENERVLAILHQINLRAAPSTIDPAVALQSIRDWCLNQQQGGGNAER